MAGLPADVPQTYLSRWEKLQTGFVDGPQHAVDDADALVAEAIEELTAELNRQRSKLRTTLDRTAHTDGGMSTEEARLAMQGYRRLLYRILDAKVGQQV